MLIFAVIALLAGAVPALAADIQVYSSGAPADVEKAIAAEFVRQSGHHVTFTVATPGVIREKLAAGGNPDIVVLPSPVIDAVNKAGLLRPGSLVDLARVGVGVIVRQETRLPDISTAEAVRRMLLDARSIALPDPASGGLAAPALTRMFDRLGVTDAVKPKTILRNAINGGAELVANGEAEIGLFNISEVVTAKGIVLVGALPPGLQSYITFAAAIHAGSAAPEAAAALVKMLSDPDTGHQWRAAGLEPMTNGP